jgi:hypothetical protein
VRDLCGLRQIVRSGVVLMARHIRFPQLREGERQPLWIADSTRELQGQFLLQEGLVHMPQCSCCVGGMEERLKMSLHLARLVV